jgi:hypothetical protein
LWGGVVRPAGTSERRSGILEDPATSRPYYFLSGSYEPEAARSLDKTFPYNFSEVS